MHFDIVYVDDAYINGFGWVQRAAAGLGVPSAVLRLFELREVPHDGDLQPGARRVAFSIPDSSAPLPYPSMPSRLVN